MTSSARHRKGRTTYSAEGTSYQHSNPSTLAIWGDPVVAQALALLLQCSGYDTRSLTSPSLNKPKAVEAVKLLVLTPTQNLGGHEHRKAFLASLSGVPEMSKTPVLELITHFGETREGEALDELWYTVPWPCRTEILEQRIEAALAEDILGGPLGGPALGPTIFQHDPAT
jgi:hypothetical protein